MAKFYIKIASLVLLFFGCAVIGYVVMPDNILGSNKIIVPEPPIAEPNSVQVDTTKVVPPVDSLGTGIKPDTTQIVQEPTEPEPPTPALSSLPVIESVWVRQLKETPTKVSHKIGRKVVVKATTESKDVLKYEITTSSGKKYTSTNGIFGDVYPTDNGKFVVVVKNTRTGEQTQCEKGGLVKNPKLKASQIESQLSNGALDKHFYFYFAKNLKFKCLGSAIDSNDAPKTLNALINVASMGFTIDVNDSTIKYDEWNRITYFEIELN